MSKEDDIQYAFYIQLQLIGNYMESETCSYSSLDLLSNGSGKNNVATVFRDLKS